MSLITLNNPKITKHIENTETYDNKQPLCVKYPICFVSLCGKYVLKFMEYLSSLLIKNPSFANSLNHSQEKKSTNENSVHYGAKFFTRQFSADRTYYCNKILMSGYILKGAKKVTSALCLPTDSYVLCISYHKKPGVRNMTGDTQLFVTGSAESVEEQDMDILKREIYEETTLNLIDQSLVEFLGTERTNTTQINWYLCNIKNLTTVPGTRKSIPKSRGKRMKISCIIWGSKQEIFDKFDEIKTHNHDNDGICGLAAIPLEDAIQIIEIIEKEEYDHNSKFAWDSNQRHRFLFSKTVIKKDSKYNKMIDEVLSI